MDADSPISTTTAGFESIPAVTNDDSGANTPESDSDTATRYFTPPTHEQPQATPEEPTTEPALTDSDLPTVDDDMHDSLCTTSTTSDANSQHTRHAPGHEPDDTIVCSTQTLPSVAATDTCPDTLTDTHEDENSVDTCQGPRKLATDTSYADSDPPETNSRSALHPPNEHCTTALPQNNNSCSLEQVTPVTEPVGSINKISQAKRVEHQQVAYTRWHELCDNVTHTCSGHATYTLLFQNLEGGMTKIKKWMESDDMSDAEGTVSLPTQIQQLQPKVFAGLERWGSNAKDGTQQDVRTINGFFNRCGLDGSAHIKVPG